MWWVDIQRTSARVEALAQKTGQAIARSAVIEPSARINECSGPVLIGERTKVCAGAVLNGPISIGDDCLIGNQAMLRGPIVVGNGSSVGFATEIKNAILGKGVSVGPMCFIADSKVDEGAYLGAMVRTSNHRLDGKPVTIRENRNDIETGLEKLGCWIGRGAALGIQVVVLPGRIIAPESIFEPRITIHKNFASGHYRIRQDLECVSGELQVV